ncbi:MAG: hypothetical protein JXA33_02215 [Anaerolineae bacterium]|nr:hypothetical protein [Anaerolineae bacterium]
MVHFGQRPAVNRLQFIIARPPAVAALSIARLLRPAYRAHAGSPRLPCPHPQFTGADAYRFRQHLQREQPAVMPGG